MTRRRNTPRRKTVRLLLFAAMALPFFVPAIAGAQPIRLVSDVWPPFTNVPEQSRVAIDLVQEALNRANVTSEIRIVEDFGEAIDGLRQGSYDGSAALWKSPEREEFLLYSLPFLENQLVLVGRKGSDVSAKSLADLAGRRLALVGSYDYGAEVEEAAGVELVQGLSDRENLDRLLAGEVDYLLVDDLLVQYSRQRQAEEVAAKLEIGDSPLIRRSLHFAVRRDLAEAASIIERFDREIRKMMGDGTYNRILQLSWIQVDVDGDGYLEYVLSSSGAGKTAPRSGYKAVVPGAQKASADSENEYWVDGRRFDSWADIPEVYKVGDTLSGGPASPSLSLFSTSF